MGMLTAAGNHIRVAHLFDDFAKDYLKYSAVFSNVRLTFIQVDGILHRVNRMVFPF